MTASAPIHSPRARRWRPWLLLLGFGVAWKLLVITLGAAVPRWVIGDGVAHLPATMQPYTVSARSTAATLWNHPLERLGLVRALRVVQIDTATVPAGADSVIAASCGGVRATVRAYTYFAIPYSQARTLCNSGVVEYRVFPHGP